MNLPEKERAIEALKRIKAELNKAAENLDHQINALSSPNVTDEEMSLIAGEVFMELRNMNGNIPLDQFAKLAIRAVRK